MADPYPWGEGRGWYTGPCIYIYIYICIQFYLLIHLSTYLFIHLLIYLFIYQLQLYQFYQFYQFYPPFSPCPATSIHQRGFPSCIQRLVTGKRRREVELKGQGSVEKQRNLRALAAGCSAGIPKTRPGFLAPKNYGDLGEIHMSPVGRWLLS